MLERETFRRRSCFSFPRTQVSVLGLGAEFEPSDSDKFRFETSVFHYFQNFISASSSSSSSLPRKWESLVDSSLTIRLAPCIIRKKGIGGRKRNGRDGDTIRSFDSLTDRKIIHFIPILFTSNLCSFVGGMRYLFTRERNHDSRRVVGSL